MNYTHHRFQARCFVLQLYSSVWKYCIVTCQLFSRTKYNEDEMKMTMRKMLWAGVQIKAFQSSGILNSGLDWSPVFVLTSLSSWTSEAFHSHLRNLLQVNSQSLLLQAPLSSFPGRWQELSPVFSTFDLHKCHSNYLLPETKENPGPRIDSS